MVKLLISIFIGVAIYCMFEPVWKALFKGLIDGFDSDSKDAKHE